MARRYGATGAGCDARKFEKGRQVALSMIERASGLYCPWGYPWRMVKKNDVTIDTSFFAFVDS